MNRRYRQIIASQAARPTPTNEVELTFLQVEIEWWIIALTMQQQTQLRRN